MFTLAEASLVSVALSDERASPQGAVGPGGSPPRTPRGPRARHPVAPFVVLVGFRTPGTRSRRAHGVRPDNVRTRAVSLGRSRGRGGRARARRRDGDARGRRTGGGRRGIPREAGVGARASGAWRARAAHPLPASHRPRTRKVARSAHPSLTRRSLTSLSPNPTNDPAGRRRDRARAGHPLRRVRVRRRRRRRLAVGRHQMRARSMLRARHVPRGRRQGGEPASLGALVVHGGRSIGFHRDFADAVGRVPGGGVRHRYGRDGRERRAQGELRRPVRAHAAEGLEAEEGAGHRVRKRPRSGLVRRRFKRRFQRRFRRQRFNAVRGRAGLAPALQAPVARVRAARGRGRPAGTPPAARRSPPRGRARPRRSPR